MPPPHSLACLAVVRLVVGSLPLSQFSLEVEAHFFFRGGRGSPIGDNAPTDDTLIYSAAKLDLANYAKNRRWTC